MADSKEIQISPAYRVYAVTLRRLEYTKDHRAMKMTAGRNMAPDGRWTVRRGTQDN